VNEKPGMQVFRLTLHLHDVTLRYDNPVCSATHVSLKRKHERWMWSNCLCCFYRIPLGRILWLIRRRRSVIISRRMLAVTVLWNVSLDRSFFYFQIILGHPRLLCYVETLFQMHDVYIMEFGRKVQQQPSTWLNGLINIV